MKRHARNEAAIAALTLSNTVSNKTARNTWVPANTCTTAPWHLQGHQPGELLSASARQIESCCGWPSFTKPTPRVMSANGATPATG